MGTEVADSPRPLAFGLDCPSVGPRVFARNVPEKFTIWGYCNKHTLTLANFSTMSSLKSLHYCVTDEIFTFLY